MKTKIDINRLIRRNIRELKPYSSARDEFKGEAEIFLDANENPYPSLFNRYPDPLQLRVKKKLASIKAVDPSRIFLGNGSDEAIDLLIRAFCEPNQDSILITEPTYGMYAVCAGINAVGVKNVSLTPSFDIDLDETGRALEDPHVKILFLCSPNNPSGNLLSREKLIALLDKSQCLVVVDEAYIDFARTDSLVGMLDQYENLAVLQTFSKAWGLAGLRLGMCFAAEPVVNTLNKIKYPYNINQQTQELALQAMEAVAVKEEWVKEILGERERLVKELAAIPDVVKVYPSDANFVLAKVSHARETYEALMKRGIIVRDRSRVALCDNCLRFTIGTPQENLVLIDELKKIYHAGAPKTSLR